jgi:hypothetical protein
MKPRGILCGDDAVVAQYWNQRHEGGPFTHVNLAPSEKEIACFQEIHRLLREERALSLEIRDLTIRMSVPRPGPPSTLSYDIELVQNCLNDATNRSVSEARKLFKNRVRPLIDPKSASRRFTRARNVIIGPNGLAICSALFGENG